MIALAMNIDLHIERLILEGLPVEQRDSGFVGRALVAELTLLLHAGGLATSLANGGAHATVNAKTMHVTDTRPQSLGQQIARAVYGGIGTPIQANPKER